MLYQLGKEFEGFTDNAMLEYAKLRIKNFNDFEKVAVISDVGWIINAIKVFGLVIPFQVNTYGNKGLPEAKAWISERFSTIVTGIIKKESKKNQNCYSQEKIKVLKRS